MRQCDYVAARTGLEQVRPHWIDRGNALLASICDLVLARIDLIEEKIDDGTRGLEKCIVTFREGGLQQLLAEALVLRAELDVRNTDLDLAKRHLREALNIQLELNDAGSIADSVRLLARIRRDADPRSAARLIGFADALRRGHGVGVSSHDQKEIADEVAALRSLIGEDAHDAEFLAGAEMQEQEGLNLVVSLLES